MDFGNAVVNGVPLLAVVIGLVAWVKEFGLSGNALRIVSMLIGLLLGFGFMWSQAVPVGFAGYFGYAIYGIGLGLVASGLYDAAKSIRG